MTSSALFASGAEPSAPRPGRGQDTDSPEGEPPEPIAPVHRTTMRSARLRSVSTAIEEWRRELTELGGASPLGNVSLLGDAAIDLTAAHPSGVAQLYAGRTTRLSNLIREHASLVTARRGARTLAARTEDLAQRYGMAPTYLAVGVARWRERPVPVAVPGEDEETAERVPGASPSTGQDRTVRAPVLLRPVRLAPHGDAGNDFDIDLEPAVEINSVVLQALRARGTVLDTAAITASALTPNGFSPRAALDRIALAGSDVLDDFQLEEQVLIGPFVHPGQVLVDDLDAMYEELVVDDVVAALAGDEPAQEALEQSLPEPPTEDRQPQAERGVGDLDTGQQHVIDAAVAGADLFVDAPPGARLQETVVALLADAAASGRRVLYVPGTRRTGQRVRDAMSGHGLQELVLDVSSDSRWRITAAERLRPQPHEEPPLAAEQVRSLRTELVSVRSRLAEYVAALHRRRQPWDVSAHSALQALAELTGKRQGPRTTVRLTAETVRNLVGPSLEHARERLVRAASLGAFEIRPNDTPWYGAQLSSAEAAREALERARRLNETSLPDLQDDVARVAQQTGLEPATTVQGWCEQLEMLEGIRGALDVFVPQIFERSAADMVIATATRAWRQERGLDMPRSARRRLRRQAKDMLRPGRPVEDLHAELVRVQEQRSVWREHCPSGAWPRLPEGLSRMHRDATALRTDLTELEEVIATDGEPLTMRPISELASLVAELSRDDETLRLMPERSAVLSELGELGLSELIEDLSQRRLPAQAVAAELDLAWWSSLLEDVLRSDRALAGYDGPALIELAEHFRELDAAQVATLEDPVRRAVARRTAEVLNHHREEAAQLTTELADGGDVRRAIARHPRLASALRPVWIVPPALVPQLLSPGDGVDLLVLDGVHHLPVAQAVAAIARAKQVVLVGDSRRDGHGLLAELAPMLPAITLPTDRTETEETIAALLADNGYDGVITPVPSPPGRSRIRLEKVEGSGMPAPGADAVESVTEEVERVVDLVIDHALSWPSRSLAVIALNSRHADRIREAVLAAVVNSPALAEFFDAAAPEPFCVIDAEAASGLRRDSIIMAVGFAKTPHGRVLHNFGAISDANGRACLVDGLDAVRFDLTVVSSIAPGDIDRERLSQPGGVLLADLLDFATSHGQQREMIQLHGQDGPQPLLIDLAERLWQLGLTVVPQYGTAGGVRIPLAIGHPDLPGELLLAVLSDDEAYVAEPSLRRRERHWVQRLVDRGWQVHTAFSTAVFLDPQQEAEAILTQVLRIVEERRSNDYASRIGTFALPPLELEDDAASLNADESGEFNGAPSARDATDGDRDDDGDDGAHDGSSVNDGGADEGSARGPRPELTAGLEVTAYSDDELDALAAWICADGLTRNHDELVAAMRTELELRRGAQTESILGAVAHRKQS